MPFVTNGRLEDMLDPTAAPRAVRAIADDVGDFMRDETRRNTPVDEGVLRRSIERTDVDEVTAPGGRGYRVRIRTSDPKAPYVEWDTRPHIIEPRRPGGTLSWIGPGGRRRFAKRVRHPGTKGHHMFALGALKTEAMLDTLARPALQRFETDLVRDSRLAP